MRSISQTISPSLVAPPVLEPHDAGVVPVGRRIGGEHLGERVIVSPWCTGLVKRTLSSPSSATAFSAVSWLVSPTVSDPVINPNTSRPSPIGEPRIASSFQCPWAVFITCLVMKLFSTSSMVALRAWRIRRPTVKSSNQLPYR